MNRANCYYSTIAYTLVDSNTIYLCPTFHKLTIGCFGLEEYDMKTKEGVLIAAFAQVLGGTIPFSYNVKDDKKLAIKTPYLAVESSNSYMRYYCSTA